MVDVKTLLRKSSSRWLRADDVQIGDKLEILGPGRIDNETFDHPYLIIPIRIVRTNVQKDARLGVRNVTKLARSFGTEETNEWIGRIAEVVSIEEYPKFGKKGIILRGLPKKPAQLKLQSEDEESLEN